MTVYLAQQPVPALQDGLGGAGAMAIVAGEGAAEEAVALVRPGLIVLAIGGRPRVKRMPWRWHQPSRHALMHSEGDRHLDCTPGPGAG
jgi:hypothetical protein